MFKPPLKSCFRVVLMTSLAVQVGVHTPPPPVVTLKILLLSLTGKCLLLHLHLVHGLPQINMTLKLVLRVDGQVARTAIVLTLCRHIRDPVVVPTQAGNNQVFSWTWIKVTSADVI